jgi:hypothetical protein
MAAMALLNSFVSINGTDLSDTVKSATLTLDSAQLDPTAMGDTWTKALGGVKSGSLAIEFVDDFAAGELDSVLFPLFGTVVAFVVRPDAGGATTSNPQYAGSVLITSHTALGSHGELAMKSLTFPTSGAVARTTG